MLIIISIPSDNYDKVSGSFISSVIEAVAFKQGSMNTLVIWLIDYLTIIVSGDEFQNNFVCDVLWCLWWCLDGYYYQSIWLVNVSFILFWCVPANKKCIHLENLSSIGEVMGYK